MSMTGSELKSALDRAKMSQADLARFVHRTPRHVNRWVQGDIATPVWVEVIMLLLSQRPELKQLLSDRMEKTL
jgi:transcriptional regulator with XRE-family HTH domain